MRERRALREEGRKAGEEKSACAGKGAGFRDISDPASRRSPAMVPAGIAVFSRMPIVRRLFRYDESRI